MGPGIRVDSGRTRRGEIMLGAGATVDSDENGGSDSAPGTPGGEAEDVPAEEGATA